MSKLYVDLVEENVIDNKDELYDIVDITCKEIYREFNIGETKPEQIIALVIKTFDVIKSKLKQRSARGYNRYKINVAGRFEIGYDNAVDEDYEKNGGFMYYIKHLYQESMNDTGEKEYEDSTITLCAEWNSVNIKTDVKFINEVAAQVIQEAKKIDLLVENHEFVMPIVCTFYDSMIQYMTIQRESLNEFEYMINVASMFDIRVYLGDDGNSIFTFTPSIESKLDLKDDNGASSQYDE